MIIRYTKYGSTNHEDNCYNFFFLLKGKYQINEGSDLRAK